MYLFKVVTILESTVQTIRTLAKWDLSCGASELSDPIYSIQYDESFPFSSTSSTPLLKAFINNKYNDQSTTKTTPVLRVHQVGKKVVKTLPDAALLGVLVLVANELLQREYTGKASTLPVYLRDIANSTLYELDSKLEKLSGKSVCMNIVVL